MRVEREEQMAPARKRGGWFRRCLKAVALAAFVVGAGLAIFLAVVWLKYRQIVTARPALQTGVQPTGPARWVDPFVATGGIPWVCGNNSPAASRHLLSK